LVAELVVGVYGQPIGRVLAAFQVVENKVIN
jgi:hypothetical protein